MDKSRETNLAVFFDFDNIALGARDAQVRFDIHLLFQRLLEKGKILVKKAYADWSYHKEYMKDLHEAVVELTEIPRPQISGKNSADIRLVVDAMDLCHGNEHLSTFVIVSGDSDFSPLVSKLRENNKSVIGVGMRNSSSKLLIANCDEFIFYDDLAEQASGDAAATLETVPEEKREIFDFLLATTQGLLREGRHTLYSSLIKDTMKRKQPDFSESNRGYSTFGDLLEDAMAYGLIEVVRDEKSGGTWVVTSLGPAAPKPKARSRKSAARRKSGSAPASKAASGDKPARKRRAAPRRKR
ncbi:MAG: NYN domain-containing protein [Candidatus Eisenbacteria sp.]|nr:NYN domain-containing protein [Candidatus Eisenbacteria bacterium]